MELSTIFAGFGGQGILFAGKVLAEAALGEGREVLWIPSPTDPRCAAGPRPAP